MSQFAPEQINGTSADEISASIRALIDEEILVAGSALPPVRKLSELLGVNRNTVLAAYRKLVQMGLAETRRGGGSVIAAPYEEFAEEGFAQGSVLRDVGNGNPSPQHLPDPTAIRLAPVAAHLYGEATILPELAEWATEWISQDQHRPFRLTIAAGAVDAIERLLASFLTPGDAVALEDPCFLTSISAIKLAGYRPMPMAMDEAGILPEALREALEAGARAVICTPRAHNPTGVSLTPERARELRSVLANYPHVLVVEDDHFSLLARAEYVTIIPSEHRRWGLVRSMSKALGPDMRIAIIASDIETAERLGLRITGGVAWVSRHMQRITHAMLTDPELQTLRYAASDFYAAQNDAFVKALENVGMHSDTTDGVNVWVNIGAPSATALISLMQRGWIAREGAAFALSDDSAQEYAGHLRLTVHTLTWEEMQRLANDLHEAAETSSQTRVPHTGRAHIG